MAAGIDRGFVMVKKSKEKRKYPRLKDENISLKVTSGDVDIITKALDISASGVYCKIEKEIPFLSRIKTILVVPKRDISGKNKNVKIEIDGVVVREHPVIVDGKITHYDVAIFFDNIAAKDRETLLQYTSRKKIE